MNSNSTLIDCLIGDIRHLRTNAQCAIPDDRITRTIKDFSRMKGAVKIELCALSIDEIKVTHVSGDVWGVYGLGKNELIGRNILKVGKMTKEYVLKILDELDRTGFVFKEIMFRGRKITSILMHRDGNNLVEISFNKEPICER